MVTFLTVLLDISVTFYGMDFERKNGKFRISERNVHFKDNASTGTRSNYGLSKSLFC